MLLGASVVIKMIASAFMDMGEERFSIRTQFRILAQAFLIAVFLTYYKTFLMTFDYMIDSLCFFKPEMMQQPVRNTESIASGGNTITRWIIRQTGDFFLSFLTQKGMIKFMHYIKSVSLLILAILGPFATLFSLLPGPFKSSFKTWSRGYINVSCWTITLAILEVLVAIAICTFSPPNSECFERPFCSFFVSVLTN